MDLRHRQINVLNDFSVNFLLSVKPFMSLDEAPQNNWDISCANKSSLSQVLPSGSQSLEYGAMVRIYSCVNH